MTELFPLIARYGPKTFNGPLKVPHLGELGMIEPQLASDMYRRIFQTLPSDDYVNFMNEFPTKVLDTENKFYHWRVAGNNNKTVQLLDWYDSLGAKPAAVGLESVSLTLMTLLLVTILMTTISKLRV